MEAIAQTPGEDGDHVTFCRLCEAYCGLVAKVREGRIQAIIPDRENPHSQGHVCVKGIAFHEVVNDPDRLTSPMRRVGGPGEFVPVSWDDALDDIAVSLKGILDQDGGDAVAFYMGNPMAFATDSVMTHGGLMKAVGSRKGYGAGSQDSNSRLVANFAVFGSAMTNAFPDLPNCDHLLIFGANPLVSNGSILYAPRIRHDLDAIAARGRVVVVDPRATETARRYEHVAIRPGTDIWLLLAMARVMFEEGLVDHKVVGLHALGLDRLEAELGRVSVSGAAAHCGIPETTIRDLARSFAARPRAAMYSRVGLCRGPFATLANVMVTALNVIAGKFGVRGGAIFGSPLLAGSEKGTFGGYAGEVTRVGRIPVVAKYMACAAMPDDILVEGRGRVRALIMTAGNPLLSAPGGARLEKALAALDLFVAFDLYMNETSRYADYLLPSTTFLERGDVPYGGWNVLMRPFLQITEAVIPPVGEARHEHEVYREIVRRMGLEWPCRSEEERALLRQGVVRTPIENLDRSLRMGAAGDLFGERDGWSLERLRQHPHGVMVDLPDPTADWWLRLGYPDRKLRLWTDLIESEFRRFWVEWSPPPPLALVGRRDIRSINSWMHNVQKLVRSQDAALLIHPVDARAHGLADGDRARLWTEHGEVQIDVAVTDEVGPGTLCYPHGWGHQGGWRLANDTQGRNINVLLGLGLENVEFVSGTTLMDGIKVMIERLPGGADTAALTPEYAAVD